MRAGVSAAQFLYTSAPFGNEGYDGLQFVGLSAIEADHVHLEALKPHVNFNAPPDAVSAPDDETIAEKFPVSYRMLYLGAEGSPAILAARYGGRVYHSTRRGKWGNTFTHALVFAASDGPQSLAALALKIDWRSGLTEAEVASGDTLLLEPLNLPSPLFEDEPEVSNDNALDVAFLSALLSRLGGGTKIVFCDADHAVLLKRYARVQAMLPDSLLRKLSWSTFEVDGSTSYDVVGTCGKTRLAANVTGYARPGQTPSDPLFDWAALEAVSDTDQFWKELRLLGGLAAKPGCLRSAIELLQKLRGDQELGQEAAAELIDLIVSLPNTPETVETAKAWSRSCFSTSNTTDFAQVNSGRAGAERLEKWSGEPEWADILADSSPEHPALSACFAQPPNGKPLAAAMEATAEKAVEGEEVVLLVVTAVRARFGPGQPRLSLLALAELAQTILRFLDSKLGGRVRLPGAPKLLRLTTESVTLWPLAEKLLQEEAKRSGGIALPPIFRTISKFAPDFVTKFSQEIQMDCIGDSDNIEGRTPEEISWSLDTLAAIEPAEWEGSLKSTFNGGLFTYVDLSIGNLPASPCQTNLAKRCVEIWLTCPNDDQASSLSSIANSWCVLSVQAQKHSPIKELTEKLSDKFPDIEKLLQSADSNVSGALLVHRFRLLEQAEPESMRDFFLTHWEPGIGPELERLAQAALIKNGKESPHQIGFLSAAFNAPPRGNIKDRAWIAVIQGVACQLAKTLNNAQFQAFAESLPSEVSRKLTRKRTFSVRGLGRAALAGVRAIASGFRSRDVD